MTKQKSRKVRHVDQEIEYNWFQKLRAKIWKIMVKIYRFFIPENFQAEMYRGMQMGEEMRQGKISAKAVPTWWLGKAVRKIIDPKHKMKIGKEKKND